MEILDRFLVLWACFGFRPNLYLIPDVDTRCSPIPVCPSDKKIIFHLNLKRLIWQQNTRMGNYEGECVLAAICQILLQKAEASCLCCLDGFLICLL